MQQEKTVESKKCFHCQENFKITDWDLGFYEKISPVFAGVKYDIPTPKLCYRCREQRRLSFRNERNLYKSKCELTGKEIISIYFPKSGYIAYDETEWHSDKWSPLDYGRDFDFSRDFFSQFGELLKEVPRIPLSVVFNENSPYVNQCWNIKDSYLSINCGFGENLLYSEVAYHSKNIVNCYSVDSLEFCYECIDCQKSYLLFNSQNCSNCSNSRFLHNCTGCIDCFCCINLSNKRYCIFNEQYSKEEYMEKLSDLTDLKHVKNAFENLKLKHPQKNLHISGSENVLGDYIVDSKNCNQCYDVFSTSDSKYSFNIDSNLKNGMDLSYCAEGELIYEAISVAGYNNLFCHLVIGSNNHYCNLCLNNSSNCFGCVGLKDNSSYCILNKQYTREEYETLVPKIIEHMKTTGEWGEFFPSSISPFGYNETVAMEYYPISSRDAINRIATDGKPIFKWSTYENPKPDVTKIIPASKLPENIKDIPDDITNWAIECEVTQKPFRIIKQELEFYRKHDLPIPRRHPDQRHLDRMKLRNPRKLYDRNCDRCNKEIKTTFSPERPEIVYCEDCYNKEII
ncbi:MAG: hypothetical protein PHS92_04920 [Candidatus Gracilibacteria bacterium]|nr:hypothetical protein [Candidatus Gracilibacteria bacterium]